MLRHKEHLVFAGFIFAAVLLTGTIYQIALWTPAADGFSSLSKGLPYWDFSNLWAGGRLALEGQVSVLFDVEAYRSTLRAWFGAGLPNQEWSYPPSILLIGVPLALLPLPVAYTVWTLGTLLCLFLTVRLLRFPVYLSLALLLSPAEAMNMMLGQNGALTAALLLGTFLLLPSRPVLAGILAGLLTIKPHLGLLIPICFLAAGQYRAILAAGVTATILVLLTALFWGGDVWTGFAYVTGPLMTAIMEADYPQTYHKNAMTVFIFARWIGFDVAGAYVFQAVVIIGCAALAAWLWRPASRMENRRRAVITTVLALVATPYGYSYDAIPLCIAVAFFYFTEPRLPRLALLPLYLWPFFLHVFNDFGLGVAVLAPLIFLGLALRLESLEPMQDPDIGGNPVKAS